MKNISLWKLNAAAKSCNTKITSHCLMSFAELTSPVQNNCLSQRMQASKSRNTKRTLSSIEFPIPDLCFFSHLDPLHFSHVFFFISPLFLYFSFSVLFIPPLHHFLPSFDSSIFLLLRSLKVRKELNNASMYFSLPFSLTCLL